MTQSTSDYSTDEMKWIVGWDVKGECSDDSCCVAVSKVLATSMQLYLLDVSKLELLMNCPFSADVQHSVSILADCLYHIFTTTVSSQPLPGSLPVSSYLIVIVIMICMFLSSSKFVPSEMTAVTYYRGRHWTLSCLFRNLISETDWVQCKYAHLLLGLLQIIGHSVEFKPGRAGTSHTRHTHAAPSHTCKDIRWTGFSRWRRSIESLVHWQKFLNENLLFASCEIVSFNTAVMFALLLPMLQNDLQIKEQKNLTR